MCHPSLVIWLSKEPARACHDAFEKVCVVVAQCVGEDRRKDNRAIQMLPDDVLEVRLQQLPDFAPVIVDLRIGPVDPTANLECGRQGIERSGSSTSTGAWA
jgi:hypothetical protein